MTIRLTYDEAKNLLRQAVEARGESYVYQKVSTGGEFPYHTCAYFEPKTQAPSCIVGHVLAYKGLTYEDADLGNWNSGVNAEELIDNGIINCDAKTRDLLETVQLNQDSGVPWGNALELAINSDVDEDRDY